MRKEYPKVQRRSDDDEKQVIGKLKASIRRLNSSHVSTLGMYINISFFQVRFLQNTPIGPSVTPQTVEEIDWKHRLNLNDIRDALYLEFHFENNRVLTISRGSGAPVHACRNSNWEKFRKIYELF